MNRTINRHLLTATAIALALGLTGAASADSRHTNFIDGLQKTVSLPAGHLKSMVGSAVIASNGQKVGTVSNVVFDAGGRIQSMTVATDDGGRIGVAADKTFVTQNEGTRDDVLLLDMSRADLAQLPRIRG